jgi:hypothetical protein
MECPELYIGASWNESPAPSYANPAYTISSGYVIPRGHPVTVSIAVRNASIESASGASVTLYLVGPYGQPSLASAQFIKSSTGTIYGRMGTKDGETIFNFNWDVPSTQAKGRFRFMTLVEYSGAQGCVLIPEPPLTASKLCGLQNIRIF